MSTLHDQLHALAESSADEPSGTGSDELWSRGKRLQRRRRVVSVGLVAVLVLGLGSLTTLVVDATVDRTLPAADTGAVLGLPDRLYVPSPWTDGTDETGPIGPLVAVVGGERKETWWGDLVPAVAGVSTAGAYAFLDLQDLADTYGSEEPFALSPDGRFVAYLITGPTGGEPYLGAGDPVTGLALYDTVDGSTRREAIPTEHGLRLEALTWAGDVVLMTYFQIDEFSSDANGTSSSSSRYTLLRWDVTSGAVARTAEPRGLSGLSALPRSGGRDVVLPKGRTFSLLSVDGTRTRLGTFDVPVEPPVHLSPGGSAVATREDRDAPNESGVVSSVVVVADASGPEAGVTRRLDEDLGTIVGWRDERHLVVESVADSGRSDAFVAVDVVTGEREQLLTKGTAVVYQPQVAAEALSGPVFAAPEPDGPGDPRRMVWLGGGLVVLLAGAALWRSRVRL